MAWNQLKDANWKVGYLGGWCEGYVSMAWGYSKFTYDAKGNVIGTQGNGQGKTNYPSATAHWQANLGNHSAEEPPLGITVPVFFSLGNVPDGHVAIRLSDGTVASSTQSGYHAQGFIHKNIQHLIDTYAPSNGGCRFLGWSEYVAGIRVVEYAPDQEGSSTGDKDMTIIVKPITPLVATLPKGIPMYDIATGKELLTSGTWMKLTQKTNIVNGSTYYIPFDRAEAGQVYGFKEQDVYGAGSDVKETPEVNPAVQDLQGQLDAANKANATLRSTIDQKAQELASQAVSALQDDAFKVAYRTQARQDPSKSTIADWRATDLTADQWVLKNVPNSDVMAIQQRLDEATISIGRLETSLEDQTTQIADLTSGIQGLQAQLKSSADQLAAATQQLRDERLTSEELRTKLSAEAAKSKPIRELSLMQLLSEVWNRLKGGARV